MTQLEREHLRNACMSILAQRPRQAFDAMAIERYLRRLDFMELSDAHFDIDDVQDALDFLVGLEHVRIVQERYGSTPYYKATAAGILARERAPGG